MTEEDYETRLAHQLQNARLERAADPVKMAEERVRFSRIREHPGCHDRRDMNLDTQRKAAAERKIRDNRQAVRRAKTP
jgi:hypothetical protein